ncbi:MAG: hypothetical protein ABIO70_00495 [Pseudomonadota bacterium]
MGNWKFWAVLVFLAGLGYAWYSGLLPAMFDTVSDGMRPSTDKVELE